MNMISTFLCMQSQIKVWHWQTQSYSEHKALGKLYETLDPLVDDFVETFAGVSGVPKTKDSFRTECTNHPGSDAIMNYLTEKAEWLKSELPSQISQVSGDRSDLMNIIDEMVAAINKTKYLLRLK